MNYKRVLLVFPAFESDTGSSRPSPSIAYIAQSLQDNSIEYDVLDMKLGYSTKDLKSKVESFQPDLVGFTLFTLHHKTVYKIIESLKQSFPDKDIIVGGPHVSIEKEKILEECDAIDYACINEGEELIVELCNGHDLSLIEGLIYRGPSEIVSNARRAYTDELDRFGFPRLAKFELDKYANEILIVSSRGCPYSCIYCSVSLVSGKKLRLRNIISVVDEVEYWYRRGKRIFNFIDDNFTFHEKRVNEFCDEMEKRNLSGLILRASNGVRADKLNYNMLKRMKDVGFRSIGIGVEAGNNKVLKILKKGESIEDIESAIKVACDLGYEVGLFFVFGTPGETVQDVENSIELALKYPVFKVDFYNLIPFPGTELYEWVQSHNAWTCDPEETLNISDKNIRFSGASFFETEELPQNVQAELKKRLLNVMRTVERKYLINVLKKKVGIFAYPAAFIISTQLVQNLYFNNNKVRKYAERFRYAMLGDS